MRVAVLDDYQRSALSCADWGSLGSNVEVVPFHENFGTIAEAAKHLSDFDVICLMRERMPVPAALLEQLPRLKLIVVSGSRSPSLDVNTARERGIVVSHTRNGEGGTAELAWGLILSSMRNIPEEHARMKQGGWQETFGTVLRSKTLGVVGLGKLGTQMATVGRAFGMNIIAWSPNLTDARAAAGGATLAGKDELFSTADVITVHLVLSPKTRGIIGTHELGLMKPNALLVNTARGPLIDESALVQALEERRIRAALDVYDQEPLPANHRLRKLPGATLTPHLGYVTRKAIETFYSDMVEAILAWRAGAPIRILEPANADRK